MTLTDLSDGLKTRPVETDDNVEVIHDEAIYEESLNLSEYSSGTSTFDSGLNLV